MNELIENRSRGLFFGEYSVVWEKYKKVDYSRKCFLFSGQGVDYPGMLQEQFNSNNIFKEYFKKSDELVLKHGLPPLSDYILNPDSLSNEQIKKIRNPCLFTVQMALFSTMISQRIYPGILTGHSFGEYAAISSSGLISFEQMFDLVYYRDYFCPKQHSLGILVAIRLDKNKINSIQNDKFHISNINTPSQTVISVKLNDLQSIELTLKSQSIDYKVLWEVPQPYHSPYMSDVSKKMSEYLEKNEIIISPPKIPLFSSVLKKEINTKTFKRDDIHFILTNQVTSPVDFIFQIDSIYQQRYYNFIEIGPRKKFISLVEQNLLKKDYRSKVAIELIKKENSIDIIKEKRKAKKNKKFFSIISKAIGKITGYEIERISYNHKFQEDLGIDSIKKAEILITVLNELEIKTDYSFNTSLYESIEETISYFEKISSDSPGPIDEQVNLGRDKNINFDRYQIKWIESPIQPFQKIYDQQNRNSLILPVIEIWNNYNKSLSKALTFNEETLNKERYTFVLQAEEMIFSLPSTDIFSFKDELIKKVINVYKFFREFVRSANNFNFDIILISHGKAHPFIEGLASFLKTMKKEIPSLFYKHIRFKETLQHLASKEILNYVHQEVNIANEIDVLYSKDRRFIPRLELVNQIGETKIDHNSVILAFGGAKGITFNLIKDISQKFGPHIYLFGRSSIDDKLIKDNSEDLLKSNPNVYYESLDAIDYNKMEKSFKAISKKHKKIDYVINGTGIVTISFIKDKTDKEIEREFYNKILPSYNILRLSLDNIVREVVNFSSIISWYGSVGQSVYTSVNEIINIMTDSYNEINKDHISTSKTIHWPPWDGVGMTEDLGVWQKLKEYGTSMLKTEQACELFLQDLSKASATSIYYMDKADQIYYNFTLNDLNKYKPLLGEMENPFSLSMKELIFIKEFDINTQDLYLHDHKVKNIIYVPAAVQMTMSLCFIYLFYGKFSVIKDFKINNPITVKGDKLSIEMVQTSDSENNYIELKSNIIYTRCSINKKNAYHNNAIFSHEGELSFSHEFDREIITDSVYSDYLFNNSLYQGPTFQVLNKIYLEKNNTVYGEIDNFRLPHILGLDFFDKLILWLDSCFQVLNIEILLKYKVKVIPTKIKSVELFFHQFSSTEKVFAVSKLKCFDNKDIRGDVYLINENGEILIYLADISLGIINKYDDHKLSIVSL